VRALSQHDAGEEEANKPNGWRGSMLACGRADYDGEGEKELRLGVGGAR
jgi:hypothetical protein